MRCVALCVAWRAVCGRIDQAVVGDGQVTQGSQVMKPNARKVRRIGGNNVIIGFAGATADALTLMTRLEAKIDTYPGVSTLCCSRTALPAFIRTSCTICSSIVTCLCGACEGMANRKVLAAVGGVWLFTCFDCCAFAFPPML